MNWVQRMRTVIRGKSAGADPQAQVDLVLAQLNQQIHSAEAALLNHSATASELRSRADEASELAARRKTQAAAALQVGDESLARKALTDHELLKARAQTAISLAEGAEDQSRALRDHVAALRLEQLQLQSRRDDMVARGDVAELDRALADVMGGMDARARNFDALEEKTARLETEAAAHREVAEMVGDSLSNTMSNDHGPRPASESSSNSAPGERESHDIDDQLEALRKQLELGSNRDGHPPR